MRYLICFAIGLLGIISMANGYEVAETDGWRPHSPRDEIRPAFDVLPSGGRAGGSRLVIACDEREGLDGAWVKAFAIQGGQHYRFTAARRLDNVDVPRRSALVRIVWQDDRGQRGHARCSR